MIFKSQVLTQASGSVGGLTYSHNRGGMYTRARATPTNPGSPLQSAIRQIMGDLAKRWSNVLTPGQRVAWTLYADNVPLINKLGEAKSIPGLAMYVRCNTPRVQATLAVVDDGPTLYTLPNFTAPVMTIDEAGQECSLAYTATDAWAIELGGAMLLQLSRPQNPSINYFKNPYRFAGHEAGLVVPPTSPLVVDVPFPVVEGQKIFGFVRVCMADGRLSEPFRADTLVTA